MMTATPNFLYHIINYFQFFLQTLFFKFFTFEKKLNFSEKMPSEGLKLVILLHTCTVLSFEAS